MEVLRKWQIQCCNLAYDGTYLQISLDISRGSFDVCGHIRAIDVDDDLVADIVGKDVVVFGERINGVGIQVQ